MNSIKEKIQIEMLGQTRDPRLLSRPSSIDDVFLWILKI